MIEMGTNRKVIQFSAVFAASILLSSIALAESIPSSRFVADKLSGCKVWNPHPQAGESASWVGDCVGGLAHGRGTLQWQLNDKPYEKDEGEWREGRQAGQGVQDWGSGRYEGEILNGEPHGRGILQLRTARYEGEFQNGKPNGSGIAVGMDGTFKGTWKDGCLIGDKRKIAIGVSSSTCR